MKFHAKMNYKQIQKQTVNDLLEGEMGQQQQVDGAQIECS